MYDIPSTPAYEANQETIIALRLSETNWKVLKGVCLVHLVCLVYPVCLVSLVEPNSSMNKIDQTDRIDEIDLT